MKLIKFLNEQSVDITHELNLIENDCQHFIRQAKSCRGFAIRSAIKYKSKIFIKKKTRQDRKPMSTPEHVHEMLDKMFAERYGWRVRSQGVFAFGEGSFLYSHYIFPIGKFEYIWSPKVKDLWDTLIELRWKGKIGWNELTPEHLEPIIKTYKTNNLCVPLTSGESEIVFRCKEYYLLRTTTIHPEDLKDYLYGK